MCVSLFHIHVHAVAIYSSRKRVERESKTKNEQVNQKNGVNEGKKCNKKEGLTRPKNKSEKKNEKENGRKLN